MDISEEIANNKEIMDKQRGSFVDENHKVLLINYFKKTLRTEQKNLKFINSSHLKVGLHLSWVQISQDIFEQSNGNIVKMARRCRERWINHLNPTLKKFFFSFYFLSDFGLLIFSEVIGVNMKI